MPERLARLEALVQQARLDSQESLPLLAALLQLDLPEARYPALQLTPQQQRQRTLETLLALVVALADQQPVLLIVEDLHWMRSDHAGMVGPSVDQGPTAPLLHTADLSADVCVSLEWPDPRDAPHVAPFGVAAGGADGPVARGGPAAGGAAAAHRAPDRRGALVCRRGGQVCAGRAAATGPPRRVASDSAAPEVPIPATLQDSLMARLDQLGPAKGTAQLGATIGREFPDALLQAVTPLDEDLLHQDLTSS